MSDENDVERKLRTGIAPFLVGAALLPKRAPYRAYRAYSWLKDLIALAAGVGLAQPLISYLANPSDQTFKSAAAVSALPAWVAAGVLFVLGAIGLYVKKVDAEGRAALVGSCKRNVQKLHTRLVAALAKTDPMPDLLLMEQQIQALLDRCIDDGIWPWDDIYPLSFRADIETRVKTLSESYGTHWTAMGQGGLRRPAGARR
jgi:hypothetical protein